MDFRVNSAGYLGGQEGVTHAGAADALAGSYRGMEVSHQKDAMSLLADAAEEMTFAASETQEKKATERRKKTDLKKTGDMDAARLMAEKLKDMKPQELQEFTRQLKDLGADAQKIKQLLARSFKDHTRRHLALSFALEELKGDPDFARELKAIQSELEAAHGPEIRAGYNIDPVESGAVGGADEGRSLYRRTVLGHADIGDAFLDLFDKYGAEGFKDAMDFLRKAIGADLAAQTPSTAKSELEQANRDLAHVQVLANAHRDLAALLGSLADRHGVAYP